MAFILSTTVILHLHMPMALFSQRTATTDDDDNTWLSRTSVLKISWLPWPNIHIAWSDFRFHQQSRDHRPKIFLPTFTGIKSVVFKSFKFSSLQMPLFLSCQNRILWSWRAFFQTISWHLPALLQPSWKMNRWKNEGPNHIQYSFWHIMILWRNSWHDQAFTTLNTRFPTEKPKLQLATCASSTSSICPGTLHI